MLGILRIKYRIGTWKSPQAQVELWETTLTTGVRRSSKWVTVRSSNNQRRNGRSRMKTYIGMMASTRSPMFGPQWFEKFIAKCVWCWTGRGTWCRIDRLIRDVHGSTEKWRSTTDISIGSMQLTDESRDTCVFIVKGLWHFVICEFAMVQYVKRLLCKWNRVVFWYDTWKKKWYS